MKKIHRDKSLLFLERLEAAIVSRLKRNWKSICPKKTLTTKILDGLTQLKLAAVLSWGETFAQDIKNKKIEVPSSPFENENEYIEWFLDQYDRGVYLKDLNEVKDIFTGDLQEE